MTATARPQAEQRRAAEPAVHHGGVRGEHDRDEGDQRRIVAGRGHGGQQAPRTSSAGAACGRPAAQTSRPRPAAAGAAAPGRRRQGQPDLRTEPSAPGQFRDQPDYGAAGAAGIAASISETATTAGRQRHIGGRSARRGSAERGSAVRASARAARSQLRAAIRALAVHQPIVTRPGRPAVPSSGVAACISGMTGGAVIRMRYPDCIRAGDDRARRRAPTLRTMDALMQLSEVTKRYDNDGPAAVDGVSLRDRGGRGGRGDGPVGQREVDPAEPDRRPGPADQRHGHRRRGADRHAQRDRRWPGSAAAGSA